MRASSQLSATLLVLALINLASHPANASTRHPSGPLLSRSEWTDVSSPTAALIALGQQPDQSDRTALVALDLNAPASAVTLMTLPASDAQYRGLACSNATEFVLGQDTSVVAYATRGASLVRLRLSDARLDVVMGLPESAWTGAAFDPKTGRVYVLAAATGDLYAVDPVAHRADLVAKHVLPVPAGAALALGSGGRLYLAVYDTPDVYALDASSGVQLEHWSLAGIDSLRGLAWSPDGSRLFALAKRRGFSDLAEIRLVQSTASFVSEASSGTADLHSLTSWLPGAPHIRSISPDHTVPGSVVMVFGSDLSHTATETRVRCGGRDCKVLRQSNSELAIRIPDVMGARHLEVQVGSSHSAPYPLIVDPLFSEPTPADLDTAAGLVLGRVQIRYRAGVLSSTELRSIEETYGLRGEAYLADLGIYLGFAPGLDAAATELLSNRLRGDPRVEWAGGELLLAEASTGNIEDPVFSSQVHLQASELNLAEGFEGPFPQRGRGVKIGIIDSGVEDLGPELNIADWLDLTGEAGQPTDDIGHGTHVATIAAASSNMCYGLGVAPEAQLVVTRATYASPWQRLAHLFVLDSKLAQGIAWAVRRGARVVNISCGTSGVIGAAMCPDGIPFFRAGARAISAALDEGVVVVAAAGNENSPQVDYPACVAGVIAVGGCEQGGQRDTQSNYGPNLDCVALYLATASPTYPFAGHPPCNARENVTGTSFAAPQVAGLAALILAEEPNLLPSQVWDRIRSMYLKDVGVVGPDEETGFGQAHIPNFRILSISPADGGSVGGGQQVIPQASVGTEPLPGGYPALIRFRFGAQDLGSVPVTGPGMYTAPNGFRMPNTIGVTAGGTVTTELTFGDPTHPTTLSRQAQIHSIFSASNAFDGGYWRIGFQASQDWGSFVRTWSGSGLLDANGNRDTLRVTSFDGYSGETRSCTYTGNAGVFFNFSVDDIYHPRFRRFYLYLYRCLPSLGAFEVIYNVLDLQNPTTSIDGACPGDGQMRAELIFDANNLTEVRMSRTNCNGLTEQYTTTRTATPSTGAVMTVGAPPASAAPEIQLVAQPNPSTDGTALRFILPVPARIRLGIFDVQGRAIRVMESGWFDAGSYERSWNGRDSGGRRVAPGAYLLVLEVGEERHVVPIRLVH